MSVPCEMARIGNPWTTDGRCQRCGFMRAAHRGWFRRWLATLGS